MRRDPRVQAIFAMVLALVSICVHVFAKPFLHPLLDVTEFLSLACSFLTFWSGQVSGAAGGLAWAEVDPACSQFFFVEDISEQGQINISLFILSVNLAFCLWAAGAFVWLKWLLKAKEERDAAKAKAKAQPEPEVEMEPNLDFTPTDVRPRAPALARLALAHALAPDDRKRPAPDATRCPWRARWTSLRRGAVRSLPLPPPRPRGARPLGNSKRLEHLPVY
jgi:hypothetical protein